MRRSTTETNFNKPLFKKLQAVTQLYENTKAQVENEEKRIRIGKSRERSLHEKRFSWVDAFEMAIAK